MDILRDGTYYAEASFAEIFGQWAALATTLLPVVSGCVLLVLLWKNHWFPAMSAVALLICFEQGLILFFGDNERLAAVYAVSSILSTSGPLILSLFIPLVYCAQRRRGATAVTGLVSFWLAAGIANTFGIDETSGVSALSAFVTPGVTFAFSIAAIVWLLYLYSENNRVYIAGLVAEFRDREIERVNEAVAKADRFEGLELAPREKEVCALLLKSFTVRQIAGELGLAFATVNGYYRSLYRKLGINSKAELFMRFGAEPEERPEPVPAAAPPE